MNNTKECLLDVLSHHHNVVCALKRERDYHASKGNTHTAEYWEREIKVAERMKVQAEQALKDLDQPAAVINNLGALTPTLHGCFNLKQGDKLYFLDTEPHAS